MRIWFNSGDVSVCRRLFLHLNKVTQLGGKDENVRCERHLSETLELLVIQVHVLHRWVKWVEAVKCTELILIVLMKS